RVVLDPAGLGEMLLQLDLADGDGSQPAFGRAFEGDGAGGCRALVDGEDQRLHPVRLERLPGDSTDLRGAAATPAPPVRGVGSSRRTPRGHEGHEGSGDGRNSLRALCGLFFVSFVMNL